MNLNFVILLSLLVTPTISLADCDSEIYCYHTKFGVLEQISRDTSGDDYSHLRLNGVEIYKAKASYINFIYDDTGFFKKNKYIMTKTVITFTSLDSCAGKDYNYCSVSLVLDFSGDKPVISNGFTPDSGNSVIDWVSWGKANSIIMFEDLSRFKYANGHVERVTK
ncbi:hypothetical protein [Pseudocitrobacter faecalis]|uniref:Uncharacterized protein n=1 Tax=Pseudocitrobacter faecalis TaxID=1398493 RepID=A0ABX9FTY6_9ENTR|nr:hypothetical protein DFQ50_106131 [Pseudocitrobacter faecalis]